MVGARRQHGDRQRGVLEEADSRVVVHVMHGRGEAVGSLEALESLESLESEPGLRIWRVWQLLRRRRLIVERPLQVSEGLLPLSHPRREWVRRRLKAMVALVLLRIELSAVRRATMYVIQSVVIICQEMYACSTGRWADTAATVQPNR